MSFRKSLLVVCAGLMSITQLSANLPKRQTPSNWQQRANYTISIQLDTANHRYMGTQQIEYFNNSPDTLHKLYFHLFFNAFQPGSEMDVRSRSISDPDPRVEDRISQLMPGEQGFIRVSDFRQDKQACTVRELGTILEVTPHKPVLPGSKTLLAFSTEAQVPVQIRRSGRDNEEGVDYSMTQWYARICAYDEHGWHPNPYIGREFYGPFGNWKVNITLPANYVVGGTGVVQNPTEVGHGYGTLKADLENAPTRTWKFEAEQVIDFAWAADPDFLHRKVEVASMPTFHLIYRNDPNLVENWERLAEYVPRIFALANEKFGEYPYPQYTVIQGGDGGMEYPMTTLITGKRTLTSLVGVTVHEAMHSWYQGVLAFNEARFPWMDEGFTTYASSIIMSELFDRGNTPPHANSYAGFIALMTSDEAEPMSIHSDHYQTNYAYGQNAYSKGAVFLAQLEGVLGKAQLMQGLRSFYESHKFTHPDAWDFITHLEKRSGMQLDWYMEYMLNTTYLPDYSVSAYRTVGDSAYVTLKREGKMPMPVDVAVLYNDTSGVFYHIPLDIAFGARPAKTEINEEMAKPWRWVDEEYVLAIPTFGEPLRGVIVDPGEFMADPKRSDNFLILEEGTLYKTN